MKEIRGHAKNLRALRPGRIAVNVGGYLETSMGSEASAEKPEGSRTTTETL